MTEKPSSYKKLENHFKKLSDIHGAMSVLHWDFAVMMPKGGAAGRSEQMATLSSISHSMLKDKKLPDLLSDANTNARKLNNWEKTNLHLMEKSWFHANAVSEDMVVALSRAGSECEMIWREAKGKNDFKTYEKAQQKVLELVRKVAKAKAEKLKCSKYDALLDQYDEGRKTKEIDKIFSDLKKFLPGFVDEVLRKQKKIIPLKGKFPIDKQRQLGVALMKVVGFDFNHGRLDVSHHPFCGGVAGDIRITTRYRETDFTSSLMGVLHETGHAMYELGLPQKWLQQPVGHAQGMTIHESQSLLMEMQVCRSDDFIKFALPVIKKTFSGKGREWEFDNIKNIYRQVKPGFIRVDADEVTYPLHVILRYEIEKELIEGSMEIGDIPDQWNKKMKEYLGIKPKNHALGCMQDIHWTDGSFGYFPTYTLGALTAAQFFAAAKKQDKTILPSIRKGNFKPLIKWLGKNIHSQGSLYTADELVKKVTGEPLNAEIFKNHLIERYAG